MPTGARPRTATATILCVHDRGRPDRVSDDRRALLETVRRHGGRVVVMAPDRGIVAAFEAASSAVVAARRIRARGTARAIGIGLAAGDVEWLDDACAGPPMDLAVDLAARATARQILVGESVRSLVSAPGDAYYQPIHTLDPPVVYALCDGASGDAARPPFARALETTWMQPFVGRLPALERLEHAFAQARADVGRVVLIAGDAGAGKTRLLAEFGRLAHDAGAAVLFGACDSDLALPYQPWVEAVRQLVASRTDPTAATSLIPLGHLIPELDTRSVAKPTATLTDSDVDRHRVYDAFGSGLAAATTRWPTVVALDDLHWAGAQTLALLRYLARSGLPRGLLVVGTFRETGDGALATCLADLHRHPTVTRLRLADLDEATVVRFVAEAVDQRLDDAWTSLAHELWVRSGGNPFYLGELWRHLRDSGAIARTDGRWVLRDNAAVHGVPDSVRDVVAARAAGLSPGARRLADVAALAGQRVSIDVVARAAAFDADRMTALLDELVAAGLLAQRATADLVYRFEHALVRDTVAAAISPLAQRHIHLALARALEQVHGFDRRPVLAELARHFVAAGPAAPIDASVYYARRAAAQAAATAAHDEAAAHLAAALELELPDLSRAQLLIELAECRLRGGHYRQSRDDSRRAFAIAVGVDEPTLAAAAALLFEQATHFPGLPGGPAVDLLRQAIELDGTASLHVRLQAALGRALAIDGRDGAIDVVERAVSAAREVGDVDALLVGLQAVITATRDPGRVLAAARDLEQLAAARADVWNEAYGCNNQCRAKIALGDLAGATTDLGRLRTLNRPARIALFTLSALHLEVILALAAGDLARADSVAERAVRQVPEDTALGDGVYGVQLFAIRRAQGRLAEVAPLLQALDKLADHTAVWRPGLAALYAELGMLDEAGAVFAELARDDFAAVPRDALWPACLAYLAETCIALDDRATAAALVAELRPFCGTNLTAAFTMCFGPADRLVGDLLHLAGDAAASDRSFAGALDLARRSRSPLWTAEVLFDWATALTARGPSDRGVALLAEAEAIATSIGMGWRRRRGAVPRRQTLPGGLSQREVDVLRLAAIGLSNREIGERLFISQHTVANHVRAILRKTGCANRTEAASFAHRHGLVEAAAAE